MALLIIAASSGTAYAGEEELVWGTYLGGSNIDGAACIAVDGDGNIYVAGATSSADFPTTSGAFDTTYSGDDAFVSKFSPSGALLWSTYLGGDIGEWASAITSDGDGNIYVAGATGSADFPTTPGAFDTTYNGGVSPGDGDAFVSKFSPDGALLWSTYLGGSEGDGVHTIAEDGEGNVYVAGITSSSDFPTPVGYDTSYNGWLWDAFISRFSASGTLLWSTYLGGDSGESASAITSDGDGNIYVAGATGSADFPTTPGAYDESYNGPDSPSNIEGDAFVSKFTTGGMLVWSTYLGGSDDDGARVIAAAEGGSVYVGGSTSSLDFPFTLATDESGGFLAKFTANGALLWSRPPGAAPRCVTAADGGSVYLAGSAGPGFPTTPYAYDTSFNGGHWDAFVSRFNTDGDRVWSTFLGGSDGDVAHEIAVDEGGDVYVVGSTWSNDFPALHGYDTSFNGQSDAFVVKFGTSLIEWDRDGDGLPDSVETDTGVFVDETDTGTDPDRHDTDGDGLNDGDELRDLDPVTPDVQNPFDPLDPDSTGDDGQNTPDGVPDGWNDWDGDGMSNRDEFTFGYDPLDPNSWAEVPLVTAVGVTALALLVLAARKRMTA